MLRYKEIKEQLIPMIGQMEPGARLPSRLALCKILETTRTTLDRAIKELEEEGVLTSRFGSGTYVIGLINGKVPSVENWGVIVPNITDATYPELIHGIESYASASGANVILCCTENDPNKQDCYIRRILASGVSGFIIVPVVSGEVRASYQLYETLQESNIPFVFCNRGVEGVKAPIVKSNDFYGGYIAARHLIGRGYQNIAFLAEVSYRSSIDRCQGYISALLEHGSEINRRLIVLPHKEEKSIFDRMCALLRREKAMDAVFCFNDAIAMEVYRAVRYCGLRISDDIGVIGYDNTASGAACSPPVSSVSYKSAEIGASAAHILHNLIHGKQPGSNFDYYLFQPNIVDRESCLGPKPDRPASPGQKECAVVR